MKWNRTSNAESGFLLIFVDFFVKLLACKHLPACVFFYSLDVVILFVSFSLFDNRLFNFSLPFPLLTLLSLLSFYHFVWLIWVCMISLSNNLFLQWWQGRCHQGWKTPLLSPVWSDRLGEEHRSGRDRNGRHQSCQNPLLLIILPGFWDMTGSPTLLFQLFRGRGWD